MEEVAALALAERTAALDKTWARGPSQQQQLCLKVDFSLMLAWS
jgi:hypothetical protein